MARLIVINTGTNGNLYEIRSLQSGSDILEYIGFSAVQAENKCKSLLDQGFSFRSLAMWDFLQRQAKEERESLPDYKVVHIWKELGYWRMFVEGSGKTICLYISSDVLSVDVKNVITALRNDPTTETEFRVGRPANAPQLAG